jgi:hypothetical protein
MNWCTRRPLDELQYELLDPMETMPEELPPHCRTGVHNRCVLVPSNLTAASVRGFGTSACFFWDV